MMDGEGPTRAPPSVEKAFEDVGDLPGREGGELDEQRGQTVGRPKAQVEGGLDGRAAGMAADAVMAQPPYRLDGIAEGVARRPAGPGAPTPQDGSLNPCRRAFDRCRRGGSGAGDAGRGLVKGV